MNTPSKFWVVVPAAGTGARFGAAIPKQYLRLGSQTVLEHTLGRLLALPEIKGVVVALSDADAHFSALTFAHNPRIQTVTGGAERALSVLNGLRYLQTVADREDWVLVHDVARPCLRATDLRLLIEQVLGQGAIGGLLATPVRDTMKRADSNNTIIETVNRERLWHALTPQMFRLGQLLSALEQALAAHVCVTDEASAMEALGHQPLLVEGHADNIKITHPNDLPLAQMYLQQQEQS